MKHKPPAGSVSTLAVVAILLAATAASLVNDKLALLVLGGGLGYLAWKVWDHPEQVLGLLFTCFCAAPFLRRLHDFRLGWTPGSLLLVAPYALFIPVALRVVRRLPMLRRGLLVPMIVVLATIVAAFLVGIWKNEMFPAILGLLEWGCGPLVGLYILACPEKPSSRRLVAWVSILSLVQFAYALYQWVQPPPWDAAWLMDSMMYTSMGVPEPFLMRPWGTLNSTGPLAVFLVWFVIIAILDRWFLWLAPGCLAAIVVTQVRAAWFTTVAGWAFLIVLLPSVSRGRAGLKLLTVLFALVVLALPFQDRMEGLVERFQTLGNVKGDTSFKERQHLMDLAMEFLISIPEGLGLGSDGRSARNTNSGVGGGLDNGFVAIIMVLGWGGATAYLGAFLYMLFQGVIAARQTSPEAVLHGVAALALLVANIFGTGFSDFVGVITWTSLAMCYRAYMDQPRFLAAGWKR